MSKLLGTAAVAAAALAAGTALYRSLVKGRLTLDLGFGRRTRALGPLSVDVAAPPDAVFATAAAPYAERRPRGLMEKVRILERTDQMVLAAHHTPVGKHLTAVTVETVILDPPNRLAFRLVRGPVPYVVETFTLAPIRDGTRITYTGELGTDLGRIGELWGSLVTRSWLAAVQTTLDAIKAESERRTR
jgi:hypothetical protein